MNHQLSYSSYQPFAIKHLSVSALIIHISYFIISSLSWFLWTFLFQFHSYRSAKDVTPKQNSLTFLSPCSPPLHHQQNSKAIQRSKFDAIIVNTLRRRKIWQLLIIALSHMLAWIKIGWSVLLISLQTTYSYLKI